MPSLEQRFDAGFERNRARVRHLARARPRPPARSLPAPASRWSRRRAHRGARRAARREESLAGARPGARRSSSCRRWRISGLRPSVPVPLHGTSASTRSKTPSSVERGRVGQPALDAVAERSQPLAQLSQPLRARFAGNDARLRIALGEDQRLAAGRRAASRMLFALWSRVRRSRRSPPPVASLHPAAARALREKPLSPSRRRRQRCAQR